MKANKYQIYKGTPEDEKAINRTIQFIYKKDMNRMINFGVKKLGILGSYSGVRYKRYMAQEAFIKAIEIMLDKFRFELSTNYIQSERILFYLTMRWVKIMYFEKIRRIFLRKYGMIALNKRERSRNNTEARKIARRKAARKHYWLKKKDPVIYRKHLDRLNELKRENRKARKNGTFKDKRFFDSNNPTKKMKDKGNVFEGNYILNYPELTNYNNDIPKQNDKILFESKV